MEDAGVHQFDGAVCLVSDLGLKFHLVEDLSLEIDARCDLDERYAFRTQFKDTTFGDIQNRLMHFVCIIAREGDVLNLVYELLLGAFLGDDQFAILAFGLEALGGEGAAVNNLLGVLGDVDESASACQTGAKLGYVQVAVGCGFGQTEECNVQAAALIEVKLYVMRNDAHGVCRSAN